MIAETRDCPFCAETIKAAAIRCRYCGSDIPPLPKPHTSPLLSEVPTNTAALAPVEISELLHSLVDRSLVVWEEATDRYHLLETMRQYARERLRQQDETTAVRSRHIDFYAELAEQGDRELQGAGQAEWLDLFEADHGNLRAALDACEVSDRIEEGAKIAVWTARFWHMRGHRDEAGQRLASVIEAIRPQGPSLTLAKALSGLGVLAWQEGNLLQAQAYYDESLEIRQQINDTAGTASCLNNMGLLAADRGDIVVSRRLHEESMALSRTGQDRVGIANSLNNLGLLAWKQGELGEARRRFEECLEERKQLGDRNGEAATLSNLGLVARGEGVTLAAFHYQERSAALFRDLGDLAGEASAVLQLADLDRLAGRLEDAEQRSRCALNAFRQTGYKWGEAASLLSLGDVLLAGEQSMIASDCYVSSASLWEHLDQRAGISRCLEGLAACKMLLGYPKEAVTILTASDGYRSGPPLADDIGTPVSPEDVMAAAAGLLDVNIIQEAKSRSAGLTLKALIGLACVNHFTSPR